MCSFGGCPIPRLTRQWTPYRTKPFILLPTNTRKPNLREGTLVERSRSDALRARCIFAILHVCMCSLGRQRARPSKRPKWSTYVESEIIGVESLCLEGLVDYSIQAKDIIINFCNSQGTFACLFANFAVLLPVMMLKRLGGGQPPSFPWHARPQSHEIQDFLLFSCWCSIILGFSKEFCDPCLGHDTIWHPRQRDEGICRQYKHVDKQYVYVTLLYYKIA